MEEFQKKNNPNSGGQGKGFKPNGRGNDSQGGYDSRNGRGRPYDNRGRGDRQGDRRDNDYGRGGRNWKNKNDGNQGRWQKLTHGSQFMF